MPYFGKCNWLP